MGKRLSPRMVSVLLFIVALPIVFNSAFTSNVVGNDLNNPNELYENCDPQAVEIEENEGCGDRLHRTSMPSMEDGLFLGT